MSTIGIPRALFYYYNGDKYVRFWQQVGFDVIVSPPTNRKIMEQGLKLSNTEFCVPVKVLCGHVWYLRDKVDYIFIPRILGGELHGRRRYGCPKFMGLPELVKNTVPDLPPIIAVDVELDPRKLRRAFVTTCKAMGVSKSRVVNALNILLEDEPNPTPRVEGDLILGVVGHPYLLYDEFLSLNLLGKLSDMGVTYVTSADIDHTILDTYIKQDYDVYWLYEREMIAAANYFATNRKFNGIIYCVSFGCGPSSVVSEFMQRIIAKRIPLLMLVLDEHTTEIGLLTRIEAFCDMLKWK